MSSANLRFSQYILTFMLSHATWFLNANRKLMNHFENIISPCPTPVLIGIYSLFCITYMSIDVMNVITVINMIVCSPCMPINVTKEITYTFCMSVNVTPCMSVNVINVVTCAPCVLVKVIQEITCVPCVAANVIT